jgi:hypothetical protein
MATMKDGLSLAMIFATNDTLCVDITYLNGLNMLI